MFNKDVYINRRNKLKQEVKSGVALFLGNVDAAFNYPANQYHFRQDSHFLYFFGLQNQGFAGVIDFDNNKDYLFGNDFDLDDIIWMGVQPKVKDLAAKAGIDNVAPYNDLTNFISEALKDNRKVHFLPPYLSLIHI